MNDDDPRVSDAATGLPPLEALEDETTLIVLAWDASEGVVALTLDGTAKAGSEQAVRYLHCRGIMPGGPTGIEWAQIHLAVPVEHAVDVAAALAKGSTLDLGEEPPDVTEGLDEQVREAGFHGYYGCPYVDDPGCPTPFLCSERGDCPRREGA